MSTLANRNLVDYRISYRISELAEMIGVSPEFIRLQIKSGILPAYHLGTNVIIRRADAEAWIISRPINPDNSDSNELEGDEDDGSLAA